jgi:hypothetical protein
VAREAGRVFLHVGLPKTGTTFLQGVLSSSRKTLKDHDVRYPSPSPAHFWAAQDLTEHLFMGQENRKVPGSWAALARQARRGTETAIISHELFTLATSEQMRRAATDLQPAELHVIVTVRDFERQVPAVWQERRKNGGRVSFEKHSNQAIEHPAERPAESNGFWRQQDAVGILGRWAEVVPREHIHVITLPQPGGPRDALWRRFAQVVGFDPDIVDLQSVQTTGNVSLRPPQARLLRRINTRVHDTLPTNVYRTVVKRYLTEAVSLHRGQQKLYGYNPEQREQVRRWSDELINALTTQGYDVVGQVDDLVSTQPLATAEQRDFDDVPPEDEAAAAVAATSALVQWISEARG